MSQKTKNIYLSWHYTTHGMAYLKHILSAFYCEKVSLKDKLIDCREIEQIEMNEVFSQIKNGFLFDRVYYFYVDEKVIHEITDRRHKYRVHMYTRDEEVERTKMQEVWREVIDLKLEEMQEELAYVKKKFSKGQQRHFEEQIWRDMQHYTIEEQIWWWQNKSNAKELYDKNRLLTPKMQNVSTMRSHKEIAKAIVEQLKTVVKKEGAQANYIINTSLGTSETQVAWFILAEAGLLPPNTRFLRTYDDKSDGTDKRFKKFEIIEIPKTILADIRYDLRIYDSPLSNLRQAANRKIEAFTKMGFAILILGERGTGKSRLVEDLKQKVGGGNFKEANCASFDDDSKAETELFGYKKGAFTGADKDYVGLFGEAKGGFLFFDEVHHLSRRVQGKLMKALQTNAQNKFSYRRLGDTREEQTQFTAIFASNLPLEELKKVLLPDFFDRIAQLIIEMPPLRQTPEEIEGDWERIWIQLKFPTPIPKEPELIAWLKTHPLYGNYRDLQKIAIYYKSFIELTQKSEKKEIDGCEYPFDFAKQQFNKYYNTKEVGQQSPFLDYLLDLKLLLQKEQKEKGKILVNRFQRLLTDWVEKEFPNERGYKKLDVAEKTFYNWKNGADSPPPDLEWILG